MIRPVRAEDANSLARLERDAFASDAWSLSQVESDVASSTRHIVVAESAGAVIGYAVIAVAGDVADLTRIVVAATNRRSGVASALLTVLHDVAVQSGVERVLLEVAESNTAALEFYATHGYAEIARRRRYYANGDDALVLACAVASFRA